MTASILTIADIVILVFLLGVALYTDLRFGKIYNKLTIPCMALGLILNLAANGLLGLLHSLAGIGLVLILFLMFAPVAGIGGGDIKLMMAVGALMGFPFTLTLSDNPFLRAILLSAIIGGVLALLAMAKHRAMLATTKNMAANFYLKAVLRVPVEITDGAKGIKFRYSPAIALGTLLAFFVKF